MAYDITTFKFIVDLSDGALWNGSPVDDTANGFLASVPGPLWTGASFEWVLKVYENYTADDEADFDDTGATAKLYITWENSSDTPVELDASGNISIPSGGTKKNLVTFTVDKGDIADTWGTGENVLIYAVIETSDRKDVIGFVTTFTNATGTGGSTPSAAGMAYAPADSSDWPTTEPDDVAEALDLLADERALNTLPSTSKTTPVDADNLTLWDSADSDSRKKLSFANLKTWIQNAFSILVTATMNRIIYASGKEQYTITPPSGAGTVTIDPQNGDQQWLDLSSATGTVTVGATSGWTAEQCVTLKVGNGATYLAWDSAILNASNLDTPHSDGVNVYTLFAIPGDGGSSGTFTGVAIVVKDVHAEDYS